MGDRLQDLLEKIDPRAGPLIMTVFGDAIAPHSADIWLGSLINLLAPLGLSERLVRTGVYRLTQQNWLVARQNGRRSYYSITETGMDEFAEADSRIYSASTRDWNGKWTIVQTFPDASADIRKKLRDTLIWRGFGQMSPTMLIKPQNDSADTSACLKTAKLSEYATVFSARLGDNAEPRKLARHGWDLQRFSNSYQRLTQCFDGIEAQASDDPQRAFVIRTILIHQYRRILLQDPQLPAPLLPSNWQGERARNRVMEVYKAVQPAADRFILQNLRDGAQCYGSPLPGYADRFS